MRLLRYVLFGAAVSMVPGCGLFKDNDPDPVPTIAPVVQPTAPVQLTTVEPPRPGEIVRPELEGRSDGITENRKSIVAGAPARATMFAPNDWTVTKTDVQMISAPDQRTRLGVANYGPEGHQVALDKSLAASGLTGCQWQPNQQFDVGKDKLYATAADGLCQRNGMPNYTGFMAVEGLFVLASWDQGADQTQMFASMRSVTKIPTGGGSATNLLACCRRLSANAASMPPPQNGFALQAAAACEAAARNNNAGGVNSSLAKFGMSCK